MGFLKLRAFYIKKLRIENEYKLDTLAKITNFSVAYISELENNKKSIDDTTYLQILNAFHKNVPNQIELNNKMNKLKDFYTAIYNNHSDEIIEYNKYFKLNSQDYIDSPLHLHYELIQFIYKISTGNKVVISQTLSKFSHYFEDEYRYAYKVYSAAYYLQKDEINKAKIILEPLLNSENKYCKFTAMAHYYLSCAYFTENLLVDAYNQLNISKNLFINENNYYRYYNVLQQEANIYTEQKSFTKANQLYRTMFSLVKELKNSEKINSIILINYSFCLIKQKKYKQALEQLDLCEAKYVDLDQYIFNKLWCLFKTDKNLCAQYICSMCSDSLAPYIREIMQIIKILNDDENDLRLEKMFKVIYKTYEANLQNNAKLFLLSLQKDYYHRIGKLKEEVKILELLVEL